MMGFDGGGGLVLWLGLKVVVVWLVGAGLKPGPTGSRRSEDIICRAPFVLRTFPPRRGGNLDGGRPGHTPAFASLRVPFR